MRKWSSTWKSHSCRASAIENISGIKTYQPEVKFGSNDPLRLPQWQLLEPAQFLHSVDSYHIGNHCHIGKNWNGTLPWHTCGHFSSPTLRFWKIQVAHCPAHCRTHIGANKSSWSCKSRKRCNNRTWQIMKTTASPTCNVKTKTHCTHWQPTQ